MCDDNKQSLFSIMSSVSRGFMICSKGNLNKYHIFQIRDVQNYVKTIVNKFMSDKISSVTRETWLSNYVEYVLINSLGMEYLKYIPRLISIDMVRCGEKLF